MADSTVPMLKDMFLKEHEEAAILTRSVVAILTRSVVTGRIHAHVHGHAHVKSILPGSKGAKCKTA